MHLLQRCAQLLACLFLGVGSAWAQCSELFFSEYLEGPSDDKCLEIFNPTPASIDLQAGNYEVSIKFSSGGTLSIPLSGVIDSHSTFVLCQSRASPALLAKAQQTNPSNFFNGDDAILLLKNGQAIDIIGQLGQPPGHTWATRHVPQGLENVNLRRKELFQSGDTLLHDAFAPEWEWDFYKATDYSDLGQHQFMGCQSLPRVFFSVNKVRVSESEQSVTIFAVSNRQGGHQIDWSAIPLRIHDSLYSLPPAPHTFSFAHGRTDSLVIALQEDSVANCGELLYFELKNPQGCKSEYPEVLRVEIIENDLPPALPAAGLAFVGYDTWAHSGGIDRYAVSNLVPLDCNSSFFLSNAVFEWKAQGYERTNRWYNGNGTFSQDVPKIRFTYQGVDPLPAGSLIEITLNGIGYVEEILVNGSLSEDFVHDGGHLVQVSSTSPDAIFLMQGDFSPRLKDSDGDSYRSFEGRVFGGLQFRGWWQPFSAPGSTGGARVSRIHPDIACWAHKGVGNATAHYGYHQGLHSGTRAQLVRSLSDPSEWVSVSSSSSAGHNDLMGRLSPYTVLPDTQYTAQTYVWTGEGDDDSWYDCRNWNWRALPEAQHDLQLDTEGQILADGGTRVELGIPPAQGNNLLFTQGDFLLKDTLCIYGNWQESGTAQTDASRGVVHWAGSQQQQLSAPQAIFGYWRLAKPQPSILSLQHDVSISAKLHLDRGIIDAQGYSFTLAEGALVIGGSDSSYVQGSMARVLGEMEQPYSFPIGDAEKYMPINLTPRYGAGATFKASYHFQAPSQASQLHPGLQAINQEAYWDIGPVGGQLGEEVRITLPWRSHIPEPDAPEYLQVAHWDSIAGHWEPEGLYQWAGTVEQGQTTSDWVSSFSPFTTGHVTVEGSLPIAWEAFELRESAEKGGALLKWKVSPTAYGGRFIVERSRSHDGFSAIDTIAFPPFKSSFTWEDSQPLLGTSYYRIVMQGASKTLYTPVKAFRYEPEASWLIRQSQESLSLRHTREQAFGAKLLNRHGQVQWQAQSKGRPLSYPTSKMPKGLYILQLESEGEMEVKKLLLGW